MSLFPAYSSQVNTNSDNFTQEHRDSNKHSKWLMNSSYENISNCLQKSSEKNEISISSYDEASNDAAIPASKTQTIHESEKLFNVEKKASELSAIKCQERRKRTKALVQYETQLRDIYFEDKDRNKRFCTIDTLENDIRPYYKLSHSKLGINFKKQIKRKRFERYYKSNLDAEKKFVKNVKVIEYENSAEEDARTIDHVKNCKIQDEQKLKVKAFNKKLAECPKDINMWLEYMRFQDKIAQSFPFCADKENLKQLTTQKKLSIIEKGLMLNQDSNELLKMKLHLMSELSPADQFINQIEVMIQKDPKNIILWQALITVMQTSCTLCKVSKILNLYVKCFSVLKQKSKVNPKFYDEQVLGLLYQCLIFLRHAGLWEQMWEIVRLNLCLNLALPHDTLQNINTIEEKTLMNMEDLILSSKLPLDQLWLRIESLRESCHWTSVDVNKVDINLIGDDKRLVVAEETNDFIYPTISRDSNFQLVIFSIICLKVPLLPCRHCTLKDFNLEQNFWSIDSLEFILPMIYPTVWACELDDRLGNEAVICDLLEGKLISGPPLLKFHPAQESFLDFIRIVFSTAAEKLPTIQRTSIFIWWLRLERLLLFITKNDPLKGTNKNKKVKSIVKSFLKKPENRNNLHFYREFALIERELGSADNCIQVLKTIIQSQDICSLDVEEKVGLFSLYRTLLDILLDSNTNQNANSEIFKEIIKLLKTHANICFNQDCNIPVEEMLYNEILKFLMNPVTDEPEDRFLLPNIYCDLIVCYGYLIYFKSDRIDNINDVLELFDKCLLHCDKCLRLQERFYETKVAFLQFCSQKIEKANNILKKTVSEGLKEFPSNFLLLSVNALFESELPYWQLKTRSKELNIWSIFATCLAGRARIAYLKRIGYEDACKAMINKMLYFHKTVARTKEVQGCPLVWKFYMLLLCEHNLCEKKGEEIYYEAVAQCPWARSVYVSAAEIAPQILPQIQDLIKEKELRMHVTPEELDILRG